MKYSKQNKQGFKVNIPKVYLRILVTYLDECSKVLWRYQILVLINGQESNIIRYLLQSRKNFLNCSAPDNAKLERAKPPERIPTTSQGGNPRSTEERAMQTAGDKKAIVWQIFRTCMNEIGNI